MKKNPLLLWVVLWVLGVLLITFKNRVTTGTELELGRIVFLNIMLDIIVVPVSIIGYFLIKFIAKAVGGQNFIEGNNALRNIFLSWLVLFVLVFLFPLFKK